MRSALAGFSALLAGCSVDSHFLYHPQPYRAGAEAAIAPAIRAPVLMLAGTRDTLIPPQHSERLRAVWGGAARLVMLPEADHNSMQEGANYWREIAAFLSTH